MNDITSELHVRSNNGQGKNVPSMKQIEEKTTNKLIECKICTRMTDEYVRIVKIINDKGMILGNCCDKCSFTHRFNSDIILIDSENNPITPESIGNSELSRSVGYNDKSNRIDEINKHRKSVENMRRINKEHGLIVRTFKQEMKYKIRVAKNPIKYMSDELKQEIIKKIRSGELKV